MGKGILGVVGTPTPDLPNIEHPMTSKFSPLVKAPLLTWDTPTLQDKMPWVTGEGRRREQPAKEHKHIESPNSNHYQSNVSNSESCANLNLPFVWLVWTINPYIYMVVVYSIALPTIPRYLNNKQSWRSLLRHGGCPWLTPQLSPISIGIFPWKNYRRKTAWNHPAVRRHGACQKH